MRTGEIPPLRGGLFPFSTTFVKFPALLSFWVNLYRKVAGFSANSLTFRGNRVGFHDFRMIFFIFATLLLHSIRFFAIMVKQ